MGSCREGGPCGQTVHVGGYGRDTALVTPAEMTMCVEVSKVAVRSAIMGDMVHRRDHAAGFS